MSNGKTICTVCNYIYDEYDENLGDPLQHVTPIKFDDLADEWRCPECQSAKEMFQPCSCVSLESTAQTCLSNNEASGRAAKVNSLASVSLGQLVAERPERACVFERYGLDYCCGGKKTLEEACSQNSVSIDDVVESLSMTDKTEPGPDPDWTKTSLKQLIEHIVACYHQPLREELPRISQLAEKVARVHGDNHPEMIEVAKIFAPFREQLEMHMQKEELILFPGITKIEAGGSPKSFGCGGGVEHPIEVMTLEHDDAGEALAKMRTLTNNFAPPADACNTFKVLLHSLAKLELEMHQHVHKENNILFPRTLDFVKSTAKATCK